MLLALGPLAAIVSGGDLPPSRGFWIEFSAALGFIALAMFALQFVLTARFRKIASPHGLDTIIQFHREAGIVAVVFALLHPVMMLVSAPAYVEYLDPRAAVGRAFLLIASVIAMVLILVLTFRRKAFGISYEWWRLTHGLLGAVIVVAALIHILQVEWYVATTWQKVLWVSLNVGALLLLGHLRVGKALQIKKRPYCVIGVHPEGERTWTLALRPVGHSGLRFQPGQFAWLTLGDNPFSLQQHPFSFSSSAFSTEYLEFTIRNLGDFTSQIRFVTPGTTAFLEGPYGAFNPDFESPRGWVLVAGGIGIAPFMSMLRTLRDRGDRTRPVLLIYGSQKAEGLTFREELESLKDELNLDVTYLFGDRISGSVLGQSLPPDRANYTYFICGPATMMDAVESHLSRAGIDTRQIHSERFDIA